MIKKFIKRNKNKAKGTLVHNAAQGFRISLLGHSGTTRDYPKVNLLPLGMMSL